MSNPQRGKPGTWEYLALWEYGEMHLGSTLAQLPADDMSAARVIMTERTGELHYIDGKPGTWYVWDGTCHRPDESGEMGRIVLSFAARMKLMLERAKQQVRTSVAERLGTGAPPSEIDKETEAEWKAWEAGARYAASLRRNAGANSLTGYLAKAAGCSEADLADRHPEWLNCLSGTVHLRTGQIKPHDPEDLITYCVPVEYKPELAGSCPLFVNLVHRMTGGLDQVADFVFRVMGYALLGSNPEQLIFFLNGPTKSGKSQVLYIVRQLLGALAEDSKADLITKVPTGRNARVENSIRKRRLVTINETSADMRIEEGQLKRITGEPMIAVDKHYAPDRIKTAVSWVIVCGTNDMPGVSSMDSAVRERIVVTPTGPTIPVGERDKKLAETILATESEAVLALLVQCASRYFTEGLPRPAEVTEATERYCRDQDSVLNFARDTMTIVPPPWGRPAPSIGMADAYRRYQAWCQDSGAVLLGPHAFHEKMAAIPGITKVDNDGSVRKFVGVLWNEMTYPGVQQATYETYE